MFWTILLFFTFSTAIDVKEEAAKVLHAFQKSINEKNQTSFVQIVSPNFELELCDFPFKSLNRADLFNEVMRYNLDYLPISRIDYDPASISFYKNTETIEIRAELEQGDAIFYAKKVSDNFILIKEKHLNCNGTVAGTMIINSKKLADELGKHLLSEYVHSLRSKDRERFYKIVQKSSYVYAWCDMQYKTYHHIELGEAELEIVPDELVPADAKKRINVKVESTILEDKTIVIHVTSKCYKIYSTFEAKYSENGYKFVKETNHKCFTKPPGLQYEDIQNANF